MGTKKHMEATQNDTVEVNSPYTVPPLSLTNPDLINLGLCVLAHGCILGLGWEEVYLFDAGLTTDK